MRTKLRIPACAYESTLTSSVDVMPEQEGQSYDINGSFTSNETDREGGGFWAFGEEHGLSMFMPSGYGKPVEKGVDYEGEMELICKMAGDTLESLPYPVIIDSGAAASVLPEKWCSHVQVMSTEASRKGEHYTTANWGNMFFRGEKTITITSREGHLRNMKFTSFDVKRAIGSVSAICKQGHTAVFNAPVHPDGSYIYHIRSGERVELKHKEESSTTATAPDRSNIMKKLYFC